MKKKLFTIFMLFIATRVPGYAAVFDLSAEAGPEYYSGYTQYQIGGMVADSDGNSGVMPFPLSQLKFPLNAFMVSGDFKLGINDFFIFHSNIKTNIFGDAIHAGKMEDSDWDIGAPDNPNRLDIFSTSDATLDAFIINTDMLIKPISVNFFSLFTGVGFLYQEFDYEIRNTSQSNYYLNESIFIPGKTLTYDVKYYIPYLEVMPVIHINDMVTISANLGFSPFAAAQDTDDHLKRSKRMKGSSTGTAFLASSKADFYLVPDLLFSININYLYISTEGDQKQKLYATTDEGIAGSGAKINNKLESSQLSIGISAGIHF